MNELKNKVKKHSPLNYLNEKLGICWWGNKDADGKIKEFHFTDSNGKEFDAYIGEAVEEYSDDLNEEIEELSKISTLKELQDYFENVLSLQCLISNFVEETDYSPIFQFNNFIIQIIV